MKILIISIAIAAIFAACTGLETENSNIMISETVPNREIEEALLKNYNLKRGKDEVHYFYNKIDLNGDGISEVFVFAYGPMLSGTGGSSAMILKTSAKGYEKISDISLVRTPVLVSEGVTNGWKDLIIDVYGGGANKGKVIMKFDGKTYPFNPTSQTYILDGETPQGIRIIADNMFINKGITIK